MSGPHFVGTAACESELHVEMHFEMHIEML